MLKKRIILYLFLFLSLTGTFSALAENPEVKNNNADLYNLLQKAEDVFWIKSQTADYLTGCCGHYAIPKFDNLNSNNKSLKNSKLYIQSDLAEYKDRNNLFLQGKVNLNIANYKLTADSGKLDIKTGDFNFNTGVNFFDKSIFVHSDKLNLNIKTDELRIGNAHFVDEKTKLHAVAKEIQTHNNHKNVLLNQSIFTTCPPGNKTWHIRASSLDIDQNKKIVTAKNIRFYLGPVPVLYFPWFRFSFNTERNTGFLLPNFKYSSLNGVDFDLPFYINIHPQFDATFTPRIISKRGMLYQGEFRYLAAEQIYGEFRTGFMPIDKISNIRNRWYINTTNRGYLGEHFNYRFDFSQTKDGKFSQDINLAKNGVNSSALLQLLELNTYWQNWNFSARLKGYQYLGDKGSNSVNKFDNYFNYFNIVRGRTKKQGFYRLPQLELNGKEYLGAGLSLALSSDASYFDKLLDRNLSPTADLYIKDSKPVWDSPSAFRFVINPKISGVYKNSWGYIKPEFSLAYAYLHLLPRADASLQNYEADIDKSYIQIHKIQPSFSVDMALNMDRYRSINGKNYLQSLTPRLFLAYSPYINNSVFNQSNSPFIYDGSELGFSPASLFTAQRLTGYDRFADLAMASFALNHKWISSTDTKTKLNVDIMQGVYFSPRRIGKIIDENKYNKRRYLTPFITSIEWNIIDSLTWSNRFYFDWQSITNIRFIEKVDSHLYWKNSIAKISLGYLYASNHGKLALPIEKNWSYNANSTQELSATAIFDVTNNWRLFGKYARNLTARREAKHIAGLEYNNCCWQIQLVYADYLVSKPVYNAVQNSFSSPKRDYNFMFNINFKGLGYVGKNINKYLDSELWSFQAKQ